MADGKAGLWGQAPDFGFGLVKPGDTLQPVLGDRRGAVSGDLKQFMSGMGPTIGKVDGRASPVGLDQPVTPGIAVHLQDAREALQNIIGILPASPRRIGEGHTGGAAQPHGRPSRVSAQKYPVFVLPAFAFDIVVLLIPGDQQTPDRSFRHSLVFGG